ncbi:P-type domain-containing protein [Sergentomyia squamirostris]
MKENETTDYTFEFFQPVVYIEFRRKKDNSLLLTTSRGPLIAAENYLEWTFFLGSHHLFGLGELNLEPGFKSILLNNHLTNAVPFILAQNVTTKMFHGIYITSPYPVEIEITKSYLVIIRAIFDMSFQIDVLCGPTIDDMMNQLSEVTGLISKHYPAWQLGLHICDTNITRSLLDSINNVQKSLKIDMQVGNPFDSHCIREHLILLGDDEENVIKQINETIVILKEYKKKIMVHVATVLEASEHNNPAYQVALEKGILMRSVSSEEPYLGRLGNRRVAYIDWVAGDRKFLKEWSRIFWPAKLNADAYMLQSNWMQDDSTNIKISSSFPYVSVDMIDASMNITPWIIRQSDTSGNASIYSHNLIASAQIEILRTIIPNNTFIISESSLFGNVPTIRRHVKSTWRELTLQVRRIMGQAISGIYFTSSNVCGDEEVISEDLCVRWYQFASLSPIYRVSLSKSPYKFSRLAQKLIKASTLRRYSLLSYFRTIIDTGRPLFTPMFYEYPYLVPEILNLSHQVLLGSSLLFAPVLLPKVYSIIIFFPEVYYEIEGGQKLDGNKWIELSVVEADAPLFIRGGHIIPIYNTTNSLSISDVAINSVNLYVALVKSDANGEMSATGEILVDEHQRITLTAVLIMQKLHLSSTPQLVCSDGDMFTIDRLKVYGLSGSNVGIHVIYQDVNQNICQIELNFTMQISGI